MLPNVGMGEIVLLALVALLLFGPKRLPEMARSLGKGLRDFKDAASGFDVSHDLSQPAPLAPEPSPVTVEATAVEPAPPADGA